MSTGNTPVNPFHAAAEALRTGQDIEKAVYGTPNSTPTENNAVPLEGEDKPEVQVEAVGENAEAEVKAEVSEKASPEISVKHDAKEGQEKKDAKQPDNKVQALERGMRKAFNERDTERKQKEALAKELSELKSLWTGLEEAFSGSGIGGVIDHVAGEKGAYQKHLEAELARLEARKTATPAQRAAMDAEDAKMAEKKRADQLEKKFKDLEAKVTTEREQAEQKELQSVVNPSFEKYRFQGKLGDEEAEHYYDKSLWSTVMDNLNELPEEKITQEAIDSEFRKVSSTFRKVINKQAETKVKKTIETKKAHAQEAAATKAMSGMQTNQSVEEFRKNIRGGNITDAFKQLVTGKIRLS